MPKYWGGGLFRTREIPRSGSKAKDREREKERKYVITMAKRMAHASTHGARKPPGPKKERERAKVGDNNGQATHGAGKPPGPK